MIRKIRNKAQWKVISHKTGRNMGTYSSKRKAINRLKQLKSFGAKR